MVLFLCPRSTLAMALAILASSVQITHAFYIEGGGPKGYFEGDVIELKMDSMTSIHTQLLKGYDGLPFCKPLTGSSNDTHDISDILSEIVSGRQPQTSVYEIKMFETEYCRKVCQIEMNEVEAAKLRLHIKYGYHKNWIIDNLPSAALSLSAATGEKQKNYAGGFPIGFIQYVSNELFIVNHVNIHIDYHQPDPLIQKYFIVGFAVEPMTVKHQYKNGYEWDGVSEEGFNKPLSTCKYDGHLERFQIEKGQVATADTKIIYTYDVTWVKIYHYPYPWSLRWDIYLTENHLVPAEVHWTPIICSFVIIILISAGILFLISRILRRGLEEIPYQSLPGEDFEQATTEQLTEFHAWSLLHTDAFRPPKNLQMLFCVMIGSGVQIAFAFLAFLLVSMTGPIGPFRRGSQVVCALTCFVVFSPLAGYASSRLYETFVGGSNRHLCTFFTGGLFPGVMISYACFLNAHFYYFNSTAFVPFNHLLLFAAVLVSASMSLTFVGAHYGRIAGTIKYPTITSEEERPVPVTTTKSIILVGFALSAGAFSFSTIYVELFFIMTDMFMHDYYYYTFGFAFIAFIFGMVTCVELTMLVVFVQLCNENHRWWWTAVLTSGSTSMYVFFYGIRFFASLEATEYASIPYFGTMALISFATFLATGACGALGSLWFVKTIYSTVAKFHSEK